MFMLSPYYISAGFFSLKNYKSWRYSIRASISPFKLEVTLTSGLICLREIVALARVGKCIVMFKHSTGILNKKVKCWCSNSSCHQNTCCCVQRKQLFPWRHWCPFLLSVCFELGCSAHREVGQEEIRLHALLTLFIGKSRTWFQCPLF